MSLFDVWMEGYCATGNSCPAEYIGQYEGSTFEEAARGLGNKKWGRSDSNWDSENLSYWGCSLYSSETKARESFG